MSDNNLTIYDIARLADVSPATVSRVINNTAPVKESTRANVQAVIDKYGFKPNLMAQGLITKETKMLGCILPDITNPFYNQLFLAAETQALKNGYTMLLANSMNDFSIESKNLQILVDKQVDGILFLGGRMNESSLEQKYVDEIISVNNKIPVVVINGLIEGVDCIRLSSDERQGIRDSVEYLHSLGHRKIEMIGGVAGNTETDLKLDEFAKAMKEKGSPLSGHELIPGYWSVEEGVECLNKLVARGDLPSALIAVNDLLALGILQAARDKGVRIPEDMSLIGFDDIYWSRVFTPRLTTVNQNYKELAEKAVKNAISAINGKRIKKDTVVRTKLVIRETCSSLLSD